MPRFTASICVLSGYGTQQNPNQDMCDTWPSTGLGLPIVPLIQVADSVNP